MKAEVARGFAGNDLLPDLVVVACVVLIAVGLHGGSLLSGSGLIVGVLGLVVTSQRSWRGKFSARLAVAIFLLVTVGSLLGNARLDWIQGFQRYRIVIELLIGIALLQRVVLRLGLHGLIGKLIVGVRPRWRSSAISILSMVLTIPLSLATVPLVTTVMASVVKPPIAAARISMRAVTISMLLLPTTLASAAVSASLPGLSGAMVALAGLPLFLVGLATICLQRIELSDAATEEPKWQRLAVFGGSFWLVFGVALALGCPVPEAVAVAGVCLYLGDTLFSLRPWQSSSRRISRGDFRQQCRSASAARLRRSRNSSGVHWRSAVAQVDRRHALGRAAGRDRLGHDLPAGDLHGRDSSDHPVQPNLPPG